MSIIKIDLKPYMENPSLYITENLLASLEKDYINEIEKDIEDVKKELKKNK